MYAAIFIDAIVVTIRDGQVANRLLEHHPHGLADEINPIAGAKCIEEVGDGRIGQDHR